jgi:hypothetical protein
MNTALTRAVPSASGCQWHATPLSVSKRATTRHANAQSPRVSGVPETHLKTYPLSKLSSLIHSLASLVFNTLSPVVSLSNIGSVTGYQTLAFHPARPAIAQRDFAG